MVAAGGSTKTGNITYAKNSDRPYNEAQPLIYFPPRDYPGGSVVQTTFIRVSQVPHTYACYGSKPHFFFGFEHGINEFGLAIGNEQVSGRERPERKWGLIGMDILRLALERARTAREAIDVIGDLLSEYGTGGMEGHRIPQFNANYIISDPREIWLFESHQRKWIAKHVEKVGYIGNCYSIRSDYDLAADGAKEEAIAKGWMHPDAPFDPALAWTVDKLLYDESEGFVRFARMKQLLEGHSDIDVQYMMSILRDHYEDVPLLQSCFSMAANKIPTICSHPGGTGDGCASAASIVAELRADAPKELVFTYWASMAPPCCSIFRPFYNVDWLPDDLQHANALYRPEDQWWRFIELERYIALNYELYAPPVKKRLRAKETEYIEEAAYIESSWNGDPWVLKEFSGRAAGESVALAISLTDDIKRKLRTRDIDRMLLGYFTDAAADCGMPYDGSVIR
jgi:dipeptidase